MRNRVLGPVAFSLAIACGAGCGAPTDNQGLSAPHPTGTPLVTATASPPPTVSATATAEVAGPGPETPSKWAKCEAPPAGMACVPGGNAVIGSAATPLEGPQHTVEISTFYVDKHEVTNGEYEACEKAKVCPPRAPAPEAALAGAKQPAVPLQWSMAHAYCVWAGKRMLTEAEWEKVARGGEEAREYPWGKDAPSCDRGQFQGCAPNTTKDVGAFAAGAYGVFDMAGNGIEWVQDWASDCYGGCDHACGDACLGLDPQGVCSGAQVCKASGKRALRGGSWLSPGTRARGAARASAKPASPDGASVRCAASTPLLATAPPLVLSDPPAAPADPSPPTADQLALFRTVSEDTDLEKMPLCKRVGEASHSCRDPNSYVVTNEPQQHLFAPYVKNLGGGYVGLGADQSYSFIAQARSQWAWLFDYDPTVVRLHYILRAIILASPTRQAFVEAFDQKSAKATAALIKKSLADTAFPNGKPLSDAEATAVEGTFTVSRSALSDAYILAIKQSNNFHWLRTDEAYKYIRTLYQQGRIVALKGNLLTSVAIPSIAASAKKLGVPVRVYYTSNADDQWPLNQAYRDNLVSLPFDDKGVMVHTTIPVGRGHKTHDWDYVIHDGRDIQRRLRHPGWERIVWLNDEGRRIAPNLVTIALPAKTARDDAAAK